MLSVRSRFSLSLPDVSPELPQDEEWCWLEIGGRRVRLRLHDYAQIFRIPGLYEELFCRTLQCRSPQVVATALQQALAEAGVALAELPILDIGAGNGMMAEALRARGARYIDALDILPEAAVAARRDRPGVYQHYYVADLLRPDASVLQQLKRTPYRCLTTVAALGFNDIPPRVFATAFNLIADQGWIAFNIRDLFLEADRGERDERGGYADLVTRMIDDGHFELRKRFRYRHRRSVGGADLYYWVLVGRKCADLPAAWCAPSRDAEPDVAPEFVADANGRGARSQRVGAF